jgi:hypothetical protein
MKGENLKTIIKNNNYNTEIVMVTKNNYVTFNIIYNVWM